ncbi:hypothetical protein PTTG_03858 [Puccinia triticina 1-1 BBBD Race 1]|uniref:40S ribosomal protein S25 n=1 Tax=Puccinia triticina (isolate 1-1 / race 1 (BBBD)) TaxID=630390 RepID=A0A0C4ESS9_PUCT1|nr:hypothetical protein PTTG_03858 [Puccinia triticina 1-1 BBBD Race 1]
MAKAVAAASGHKAAKKKKWSKGKVRDKSNNHVICDKPTFDKIFKEVPTYKMISQSVLIDRMKINGSLARVAIQHLEREGLIKRIVHHRGQLVYIIREESLPVDDFTQQSTERNPSRLTTRNTSQPGGIPAGRQSYRASPSRSTAMLSSQPGGVSPGRQQYTAVNPAGRQ